jgi:Tol biopolymer transport system component
VTVTLPVTLRLGEAPAETSISPDGRFIAFSAAETGTTLTSIWVRAMNSTTPRKIPGTDDARIPFWSPDGRDIGFFAGGQLKRALADGTGSPQVICPAKDGRGATWNRDGVIVFAPTNAGGLFRVSANGGDPVAVTSLDASRQETGQRFPQFLPDQKHFLFVELPAQAGLFQISVGSLDSKERTRLRTADGGAVYVTPGYLVFSIRHQLAAQRFDAASLTLAGDPIMIGDLVDNIEAYSGGLAATGSGTGVLVFPHAEFTLTELRWIDPTGKDLGRVPAPAAAYGSIRISPDGKRAAVLGQTSPGQSDLWVLDLERGGTTRLTPEQGVTSDPVWSPDSSHVLYGNNRNGHIDFYMKAASGSGTEEIVYSSPDMFKTPRAFSPDGKYLVYWQIDPQTHRDIWILPMEAPRTPRPFRNTPSEEQNPAISPDGKWLAYTSDETGRNEIYVESFPTPGKRFQITTSGGSEMVWRRDGKQVYVASADGRTLMVADVLPGSDMKLGPLRPVLTAVTNMTTGDVTSDFQRVLIAVTPDGPAPRTLTVLLDWTGALRH